MIFCYRLQNITKTFRVKNNLLSVLFSFFHMIYSCCTKEFKNAIKNANSFFLVCPTYVGKK